MNIFRLEFRKADVTYFKLNTTNTITLVLSYKLYNNKKYQINAL